MVKLIYFMSMVVTFVAMAAGDNENYPFPDTAAHLKDSNYPP
jgi:hypothetical protein